MRSTAVHGPGGLHFLTLPNEKRRWNFIFGGIHIRSGYGRGLGLDMGGHHASYRANLGRPLFLLPELRSALCSDVFAACGQRQQQRRNMCGLRTNHG
jgi:hypothetical protein